MRHDKTPSGRAFDWLVVILALAVLLPVGVVSAQPAQVPSEPLAVATRDVAPFAMKGDDGVWRGITIDLWEAIATARGWEFVYVERSIQEMFDHLESGDIDVAAAALTITAERERIVDFSHPFFHSGLGIAVPERPGSSLIGVMRGLISMQFLQALLGLAVLLLVWGILIWAFERRRNEEQFGGSAIRGIGAGFWWSAVTMTTVGYGDKSPITLLGRLVALVWMFASIIVISGITAAIASALTVASLQTGITGPDDLDGARVGTVANSTSETYLRSRNIRIRTDDSLHESLAAVRDGDVEAVVYDAPILSYLISREFAGELRSLGYEFDPQNYGIAMAEMSPLREEVNRSLLDLVDSGELARIKDRYLRE